jgi:hypothetical protein
MAAWLTRLNADTTLNTLMGAGWLYPAGANRPVKVPSGEYSYSGNPDTEVFDPVFVRLDLFVQGSVKCGQVEQRIRDISHRKTAQTVGALRGWIRYLDSRDLDFPSTPGVVHRALDWTLETVRD